MNNVRATKKINEAELEHALRSGSTGASWHDEYKDSAYIFVGGLPHELTEGDVITIFSQFGEVMDINMPRDKDSGKRRGFGFLMYEDQRSTVLAVDNLNGADILGRTIRVDHVKQYKQRREKDEETGEWVEPESQSLNAAPSLAPGSKDNKRAASDAELDEEVDLEDPMTAYFAQNRREERASGVIKSSEAADREAEKESKRQRKEERARKRARKEERRRHRDEDEGRSERSQGREHGRARHEDSRGHGERDSERRRRHDD